jgi:HEAT repeat protein
MGLFHKKAAGQSTTGAMEVGPPSGEAVAPSVADLKARGDANGLVAALAGEGDPRARTEAAWALVDLREPRAADCLIGVASRREEPTSLRFQAIGALGKLHDPQAVDALSSLLRTRDEPAQLQAGAAVSLGWIGDSRAAEALAEAWMEAQDDRVQEAAGKAFLELHVAHSQYLLDCLKDPDRCERAASLLGRFADASALGPLEELRQQAAERRAKGTVRACKEAITAIRERATQASL